MLKMINPLPLPIMVTEQLWRYNECDIKVLSHSNLHYLGFLKVFRFQIPRTYFRFCPLLFGGVFF